MILQGKVVLVTGGARGLGQAMCVALAEAGARIAVLDLIDTADTMTKLKAVSDTSHVAVTGDVTNFESLTQAVSQILEQTGTIDALVNNAGLYSGVQMKPFDELTESEWDRMMTINVKGIWNVTRAVLPAMRKQGYGKVVNISSTTMLVGAAGMLHYVASKGAVFAMTRSMARELGPQGIRVNTIMPGLTLSQASIDNIGPGLEFVQKQLSQVTALGRLQQPEDVAGSVVYLVSPLSDAVTGQALNVDGGMAHW